MKAETVWVPGVESDDGVIVADAASGDDVLVQSDEVRHVAGTSRFGRVVRVPLVRGVVVGREGGGELLVVRFGDGKKVRVERQEGRPAPDPNTDSRG